MDNLTSFPFPNGGIAVVIRTVFAHSVNKKLICP